MVLVPLRNREVLKREIAFELLDQILLSVHRDVDLRGDATPLGDFSVIQANPLFERAVIGPCLSLKSGINFCRLVEMPLRHAVSKSVVVDVLVELIGANHTGQFVAIRVRVVLQPADPEAAGLVEHLCAVVAHEVPIVGRGDIGHHAISDAGRNVDFLFTCPYPVDPVGCPFGRGLNPGISTLPRILRA